MQEPASRNPTVHPYRTGTMPSRHPNCKGTMLSRHPFLINEKTPVQNCTGIFLSDKLSYLLQIEGTFCTIRYEVYLVVLRLIINVQCLDGLLT